MNKLLQKSFDSIHCLFNILIQEEFDYSYKYFNQIYTSYRHQVIRKKIRYDRFVSQFIARNQMITFSLDSNGNPNVSEYNQKNLLFNNACELLQNRKDIVEKYFSINTFRYSDYRNLINDLNTTNIIVSHEIDIESKLEKVREKIALCLSQKNGFKKHEGQRIFGFILRERHFPMFDGESRENAFKRFMRTEHLTVVKSNYFGNPYYDRIGRSKRIISSTNETLKNINSFFKGIDLEVTVFENDNKTR